VGSTIYLSGSSNWLQLSLQLEKHAQRLRADTRLGPWLFTVARNLHISYNRSQMLEDSAASSLIALWPFSLERWSPFDAAAASELERRIERALAAMPTASREVLLLVGVAGLDSSDAADICGITPEALRQRLHRARETLERDAADRGDRSGTPRVRPSLDWHAVLDSGSELPSSSD
jgi:RNA polymerase sigma factor (sigma-70 family)